MPNPRPPPTWERGRGHVKGTEPIAGLLVCALVAAFLVGLPAASASATPTDIHADTTVSSTTDHANISAPSLYNDGFDAQGQFEATFGNYPGLNSGPKSIAFNVSGTITYSLSYPFNVTAYILAPSSVTVPTGCTAFGSHCTSKVWDFSSWDEGASIVSSSPTLQLGGANGLPVTAGSYANYTAVFHDPLNETGTSGTGGALIAGTVSLFDTVFVQFWYAWLLVLVILVAGVGYAESGRSRRKHR